MTSTSSTPAATFCQGSPQCIACGADHQEGVWQRCPCTIRHLPPVEAITPPHDPLACAHLGEPTGKNVEQLGCGCPGARMTGVWTCDARGLCAPLARVKTLADEAVTACPCDRYEAQKPAATGRY